MKRLEFNPCERYGERANDYSRYRPGYPRGVLEFFRAQARRGTRGVIGELGSGTGIFTRQLLAEGWSVFAVEPDARMREHAEREHGGHPRFTSVPGTAEETTLRDREVEAVIVAQAFHWFDGERARAEIERILVPGGTVTILWNELDRCGDHLHEALDALRRRCLDFRENGLGLFDDYDKQLRDLFSNWSVARASFPHVQSLSAEGLRGRMASNSSWPDSGSSEAGLRRAELDEIFASEAKDGCVELRYTTEVLHFSRVAEL